MTSAYDARMGIAVATAVRQHSLDFASLSEVLPGVYPQELLRILREYRFEDSLMPRIGAIADSASLPSSKPERRTPDDLPHPLDYEWRFTAETMERLRQIVNRFAPIARRGAAVATPSIGAGLDASKRSAAIDYFGLPLNPASDAGFAHWQVCDLLRWHEVEQRYDFVITDPPWYPDYIHRFVDLASRLLVPGGFLFLAIPAIGTRPGIESELEQVGRNLHELGMIVRDKIERVVNYETPHFEKNALNAAGILNVHPRWRWADLWIAEKVGPRIAQWPGDLLLPLWKEYRFGPVRIRARCDKRASTNRGASLDSLVPGDILPTVSRRDPRRATASVWTTGNRIFSANNLSQLHAILQRMAERLHSSGDTALQLSRLIETELHEL